jgi:hypothetical protein
VTKVLVRLRQIVLAWCLLTTALVLAQPPQADSRCPQSTSEMYARLRTVGLDPGRVYRVRDASLDRPGLGVTLEDGTIAFTEDICGRVTGAFFVGDGEILLRPPNRTERASLNLFTGMAILEERFSSAYLRFNNDTAELLQSHLTTAQWTNDEFKDWDDASRRWAEYDALRLFVDFSHFLPGSSPAPRPARFPSLLHLHLVGSNLGVFDVLWDDASSEPLWTGQLRTKDDLGFLDVWTSFAPNTAATTAPQPRDDLAITAYRIRASVQPPTELQAVTEADLQVRRGGQRAALFELSRYLKVDEVNSEGHALDFIQNPALEGSQLARRGNDLIAIVFPTELAAGQVLKLRFHYAGDVLSDAGSGLLYVGARGSWYPSLGMVPASFDMEFRYPAAWTLLATGKRLEQPGSKTPPTPPDSPVRTAHWVSERPIPLAGFNLGKYLRAEAKAGNVLVEAYGTKGVEKTFPQAPPEVVSVIPALPTGPNPNLPLITVSPPSPSPSPARDLQTVADRAAKAVTAFSQWYGPYPYGALAFTQMPGALSQGWPSLVFLSSFAFLSPEERADLKLNPVDGILNGQVLVHETAHQWWGDLIQWKTYRDQWISEGLANYSSLLLLEQENPAQFREVMEKYRSDLLSKNKDGEWLRDAGPVTLGQRLVSSHFPDGYEAISYERGTWLFHMLRSMLRDAEAASPSARAKANPEEPFFRALRKVRERYAGKAIGTREMMQVFEEELPRPLWYENRRSLNWFVESWIDGTAIPRLEMRTTHIDLGSVSGTILQKGAPENLVTAVPVYAETTSNPRVFLGEVLADGPETKFHLAAPPGTRKLLLDPHQTILTTSK